MSGYAGLVGALIGFALGLLEYTIVSRVVVAALRRTEASGTDAEHEDYERRIRLLKGAMLVMMVGGMPIAGYWIGRALFG